MKIQKKKIYDEIVAAAISSSSRKSLKERFVSYGEEDAAAKLFQLC